MKTKGGGGKRTMKKRRSERRRRRRRRHRIAIIILIIYPKFKVGAFKTTLYHELTRKFSFNIIGLIPRRCVPVVTDALDLLRSTKLFTNIKPVLISVRIDDLRKSKGLHSVSAY